MQIETQKCTLDTLSVTIQALHVSGKQMTLAVFRQLPVGDLYGIDGRRRPGLELWGIVRYQFKKDGPEIWVVASDSGILYRCELSEIDIQTAKSELEKSKRQLEYLKKIAQYPGGSQKAKDLLIQNGEKEVSDRVECVCHCYNMMALHDEIAELPQLFIAT